MRYWGNHRTKRRSRSTARAWAGILLGTIVPSILAANEPIEATASLAGRAGYIGFETFGRNDSISHIELLPYLHAGQHTFFSDLRLFATNRGRLGGNSGVGYRYHAPQLDRFFGGNLWYDADDTTGELFHQIGLGLETYGPNWDLRSNFYLPVSGGPKTYALGVLNQRFVGNQILYDGSRTLGQAMEGFDLEFGVPLPSAFATQHQMTGTVGAYFFFGDVVSDVRGVKVRTEGYLTNNITMQAELTDDNVFGTRATLGMSFVLGTGSECRDACDVVRTRHAQEFVRRNYNVIVSKREELSPSLVAMNSETDLPYLVQHVSSTPGGLDQGTADNPFHAIADAQAAGGDFVFAHADSLFSDAVVMAASERILGEGIDYRMSYGQWGEDWLPRATAGSSLPTLQGVTGTAVTLAADTVLSGFVIDSPTQDGLLLQNVTGDVMLSNVHVTNAAGAALHVDGGAADLNFEGTIANGAGRSVLVENTTGGSLDLLEATIEDVGGDGILIDSADGTFDFGTVEIAAATGTAGVRIVDSPGETFFEQLDITTDNATGLFVRDSGLLTIADGSITSTDASAVDIEGTETNIFLTRIASDGANVGVRIVDNPGSFHVIGEGTPGSGGRIENATTGVLLDNVGTVTFKSLDLDANGVGMDATGVEHLALIDNRITSSTGYGLDVLNTTTVEVHDSVFEDNGGAGTASIRIGADADGEYGFALQGNTITDDSDAAVSIYSTGAGDDASLSGFASENVIRTSAAGADGLRLAWNGSLVGAFLNNQFTGTGASSDGLDIAAGSALDHVQIAAAGNSFDFVGGGDTGIRIETLGPARLAISSNDITFGQPNGVGMDLSLATAAEVFLTGNVITDHAEGGTGILFRQLYGPADVTIDSNLIQLLSDTATPDRGIIFSSVTHTFDLMGTRNNVVNGASTLFSIPAGATDGHIYINGFAVP